MRLSEQIPLETCADPQQACDQEIRIVAAVWPALRLFAILDGRSRAIVIAESLARVIAAIQITSVCWRSHLPKITDIGPHRPCIRCVAIRVVRLAFVRVTFVQCGIAEWPVRVDSVR